MKTSSDNFQLGTDPGFCCNNGNNPSSTTGMWLHLATMVAMRKSSPIRSRPLPAVSTRFLLFPSGNLGTAAVILSHRPVDKRGRLCIHDDRLSGCVERDYWLADVGSLPGSRNERIATLQQNDAVWRQFSFMATAPAGTAKVQVEAGAANMYNTGVNPQSAFFDDFSLTSNAVRAGVPRRTTTAMALSIWPTTCCGVTADRAAECGQHRWNGRRFGLHGLAGAVREHLGQRKRQGLLLKVPEPTGMCFMLMAVVGGLVARRRDS